jgi:hypothetical protein
MVQESEKDAAAIPLHLCAKSVISYIHVKFIKNDHI